MKTALTITRSIGVLGAAWIICMLISTHLQIHAQTKDLMLGSFSGPHPMLAHILHATIPFGFLAVLLILPFTRMPSGFAIAGAAIIAIVSGYFMIHLFGQYFLASRFVPEAIPSSIWIAVMIALIFFLTQIAAIILQTKKVEQGACTPPSVA